MKESMDNNSPVTAIPVIISDSSKETVFKIILDLCLKTCKVIENYSSKTIENSLEKFTSEFSLSEKKDYSFLLEDECKKLILSYFEMIHNFPNLVTSLKEIEKEDSTKSFSISDELKFQDFLEKITIESCVKEIITVQKKEREFLKEKEPVKNKINFIFPLDSFEDLWNSNEYVRELNYILWTYFINTVMKNEVDLQKKEEKFKKDLIQDDEEENLFLLEDEYKDIIFSHLQVLINLVENFDFFKKRFEISFVNPLSMNFGSNLIYASFILLQSCIRNILEKIEEQKKMTNRIFMHEHPVPEPFKCSNNYGRSKFLKYVKIDNEMIPKAQILRYPNEEGNLLDPRKYSRDPFQNFL